MFIKKKKQYKRITFSPVIFTKDPEFNPILPIPVEDRENFDIEKEFKERKKLLTKMEKNGTSPIKFYRPDRDLEEHLNITLKEDE